MCKARVCYKCFDSKFGSKWETSSSKILHKTRKSVNYFHSINPAIISYLSIKTFEFSLNYTKLVTLPTKAYKGENKINSAKKLSPVGIESKTSSSSLQCSTFCASHLCVGQEISEVHFVSCTTSQFGL